MGLTVDTFERPPDLSDTSSPEIMFFRSNLATRLIIGGLGVLLPVMLWMAEGPLLKGDWRIRDSLSAYYHTGARDIFVAVLCAVGLLLITYMSGKLSSPDFILSSIAGVTAIGVALLPTKRSVSNPACGPSVEPIPEGCTRLQNAFGEIAVSRVHLALAGTFILTLAVICFVFAMREWKYRASSGHGPLHIWFHAASGVLILLAVVWAFVGVDLTLRKSDLSPLYVTEVVAIFAFGFSWFLKGFDLLHPPDSS